LGLEPTTQLPDYGKNYQVPQQKVNLSGVERHTPVLSCNGITRSIKHCTRERLKGAELTMTATIYGAASSAYGLSQWCSDGNSIAHTSQT